MRTHSGGYCGCSGKNVNTYIIRLTAIIIGQVVHFKYKLSNTIIPKYFSVVKVFLNHYNKYLII